MEKEFVPYEQALALKELRFDEPCFGFYTEEYKKLIKNFCKYPINLPTNPFLAPTFSQAFRWFREKYDLRIWIDSNSPKKFDYTIATSNPMFLHEVFKEDILYKTYEEAELECIKKLIEIVKYEKNSN